MGTIDKLQPALPKGSLRLLKRVFVVCGCVCFIIVGCAGNSAVKRDANDLTGSKKANAKVKSISENQEHKASNPFLAFWHKAWKILTGNGNENEIKLILPPSSEKKPTELSRPDKPRLDFPIVYNKEVKRFVRLYEKYRRVDFQRRLSRAHRYLPLMKKIFKERGVPEELVYVALVESGFHPMARSNANAVGIWQFTRATGKHYGLRYSYWFDERRDPVKSTVAAAMYLSDLYEIFNDWYLALAAYNAGTGAVERAIKRYRTRDFWKLAERKALPRQTRNYVPKILAAITIAKNPEKYGFNNIPREPILDFEDIVVSGNVNLRDFAKWLGVRTSELQKLNPELLGNRIYAGDIGYRLRLPKNSIRRFLGQHGCILPGTGWKFAHYYAKRGENLYSVATEYGTDPLIICQANDLSSLLKTKKRQHLLIPVPQNTYSGQVLTSVNSDNSHEETGGELDNTKDLIHDHSAVVINQIGVFHQSGKKLTGNQIARSVFKQKKYSNRIKKPGFFSRLFPGSRYLYSLKPQAG